MLKNLHQSDTYDKNVLAYPNHHSRLLVKLLKNSKIFLRNHKGTCYPGA